MKSVKIPSSKSDVQRAMLCAAIDNIQSFISGEEISDAVNWHKRVDFCGQSDDIEAMKRCLDTLVTYFIDITSRSIYPASYRMLDMRPNESGAVLRFLLPICGALDASAIFFCEGNLINRPIEPLISLMREHGCDVNIRREVNAVSVSGRLRGGKFEVPGNVSSQFISGLIFALPLTEEGGSISILGEMQSAGYVEMTVSALLRSGIEIFQHECGGNIKFTITGSQRYKSPVKYRAEKDWSAAAVWIAIEFITGEKIMVEGLNHYSSQPDRRMISISKLIKGYREFHLSSEPLSVNCEQCPDIAPMIALLASVSQGCTIVICGAERLRFKESDRLRSTADVLSTLGADIKETADGFEIRGVASLRGGEVSSCGDHRIAMMAAAASLASDERVIIKDACALSKTYPEFRCEMNRLKLDKNIIWR